MRRTFLLNSFRVVVGAFCAAIAATCAGVVRFLFPKAYYESPRVFTAGRPGDLRIGPPTLLTAHRMFMSRQQNGVAAMTSTCTHLGCTVEWFGNDRCFHCPCHGSIYTAEGAVRRGPAQRELEHYQVGFSPNGELRVDKRRIVPADRRLKV